MKIGLGCPLGSHHWHWGHTTSPHGWAVYLGPVYLMRVR